jgi:hypothetical protein
MVKMIIGKCYIPINKLKPMRKIKKPTKKKRTRRKRRKPAAHPISPE